MKKVLVTIFANLLIINFLAAQKDSNADTVKINSLDEVVISANKVEESKLRVAQQMHVIGSAQIAKLNPQNSGDMLAQTGFVALQKSQQGGSSPILRGFEASRVLLVVDGVRMNNLIYRAGHLQNVITIDPNMLERAEVIFGPSSTVYGSDALGGVVHFHTKNPLLNTEGAKNLLFKGNAYVRYSSANAEKTGHLDLNLGLKKFASLTSITASDFGDMTMGKRTQSVDTLWGLRKLYQTRINNRDTALVNPDPYKQVASGYQQIDVLQKLLFQQSDRVSHLVNLQYSNTSNIPRYDRLTDPKGAGLNQGEWYYGPQYRLLTAYELNIKELENKLFQNIKLNVNYQDVEESRHTRGFAGANLTSRIERVNVVGTNLDFQHVGETHNLRTGIDFQSSTVKSTARLTNASTGVVTENGASTRYPDGDNSMLNLAAYLTHTWKISDVLTVNDGLRLGISNLKSTFVGQTFYKFPFTETKQDNFVWNANLGVIYAPEENTKVSLLWSSGYRVPNVDDLTKIFDTNTGRKLVVVPNPDLKPERTNNFDLTIAKSVEDFLQVEATGYYTLYRDALVVAPFKFNGQDSIVYDGVKSQVQAPQNTAKAYVWGASLSAKLKIMEGLTASASYNYTKGRVQNANGTETPLDHVAPVFGRFGVQYAKNKFDSEFFVLFNGAKKLTDYSPSGEDNIQYATPVGMPSWWTMNIRGSYEVLRGIKIQLGVENLMDIQYRMFASGIHSAGRNVYATVRASF